MSFLNLLLAFVWVFATGRFSTSSLVVGWILGAIVLALTVPGRQPSYGARALRVVRFVLFMVKEILIATARVAWDAITPTTYMRPGVVGVPLDARTDAEITLVANVITLTPGTVSLDVSEDRRTLYVHVMFLDDLERVRRELKEQYEGRILELTR